MNVIFFFLVSLHSFSLTFHHCSTHARSDLGDSTVRDVSIVSCHPSLRNNEVIYYFSSSLFIFSFSLSLPSLLSLTFFAVSFPTTSPPSFSSCSLSLLVSLLILSLPGFLFIISFFHFCLFTPFLNLFSSFFFVFLFLSFSPHLRFHRVFSLLSLSLVFSLFTSSLPTRASLSLLLNDTEVKSTQPSS